MSHRNAYILLSVVALRWAGNFPASKIGLSSIRWYHAVGATVVIAGVVLTARR